MDGPEKLWRDRDVVSSITAITGTVYMEACILIKKQASERPRGWEEPIGPRLSVG